MKTGNAIDLSLVPSFSFSRCFSFFLGSYGMIIKPPEHSAVDNITLCDATPAVSGVNDSGAEG